MERQNPEISDKQIILRNRLILGNIVLIFGLMYFLVPVLSQYFVPLFGTTIHLWDREVYFISLWNRDLNEQQAEELLTTVIEDYYSQFTALDHLQHHAREPLVNEYLRNQPEFSIETYSAEEKEMVSRLKSIMAKVVLYRTPYHEGETWESLLPFLKYGGLTEEYAENLYDETISYDSEYGGVILLAKTLRKHSWSYLHMTFDPDQDVKRLAEFIELMESPDPELRDLALDHLFLMKTERDVLNVLIDTYENDPDEDLRDRAWSKLVSDPSHHDFDYEEYALKNIRGFYIWVGLMMVSVSLSVVMYRKSVIRESRQ